MTRYDLAYDFIPTLIEQFNIGVLPKEGLFDKEYLETYSTDEPEDFNWDDFQVEFRVLSDIHSVVLYTFPEPQTIPDAKFGLLFFDSEKKDTQYYTLEKTYPKKDGSEKWMIGSIPTTKDAHLNLGPFSEEPTLENFLTCIYEWFIIDDSENS